VARKGHDMVIRVLPRVLQKVPNVTFLIAGDGPYRGQLEQVAAAVGVQDRVIFANKISDQDLPDVYALSDVFVMPSRAQLEKCDVEGFGLVFLEANACGKPVIGGRSGGIPDAIVDGETGLLVNPHDLEDIASALIRLLSDHELADRLGEQGRLRVVNKFNWMQVGDRVQSIMNAVVQETRCTARS
jgi:phosphatidylinositol alpha-1,6-mannosyltransferase